jgi:hypothetical protein
MEIHMLKPVEFDFYLPRGYRDANGTIHQDGRMRLAEAMDEIEAINDPRVQLNEAYLPVVLFSRVITRLGGIPVISTEVIERLFISDFLYLEDLYSRINGHETVTVAAVCPHCSGQFQLQVAPLENGDLAAPADQ